MTLDQQLIAASLRMRRSRITAYWAARRMDTPRYMRLTFAINRALLRLGVLQ